MEYDSFQFFTTQNMKYQFSLIAFAAVISFYACKNDTQPQAPGLSEAGATPDSGARDISFAIDTSQTRVLWSCSKPGKTHTGYVKAKDGRAVLRSGSLVGGRVLIDMNSITVTDLEGDSKAQLEAHLKGNSEGKEDDFFNVQKYPYAEFEITRVSPLINDDNYNALVYGNLDIKGLIREIGFRANIQKDTSGLNLISQKFSINRTEWGIHFRSKSIFSGLKDRFIDDEIELEIRMFSVSSS